MEDERPTGNIEEKSYAASHPCYSASPSETRSALQPLSCSISSDLVVGSSLSSSPLVSPSIIFMFQSGLYRRVPSCFPSRACTISTTGQRPGTISQPVLTSPRPCRLLNNLFYSTSLDSSVRIRQLLENPVRGDDLSLCL